MMAAFPDWHGCGVESGCRSRYIRWCSVDVVSHCPTRAVGLPTLSRSALQAEGFEVIERRQPSLLLDGSVLITGEVDRTTEFERGMPNHEAWRDGRWEPDPLILDEQALVVHVRGQGLSS